MGRVAKVVGIEMAWKETARGLVPSKLEVNRVSPVGPTTTLSNKQELLVRITVVPMDPKGLVLQEGVHLSRR